MVFRMELTHHEIAEILDSNYIDEKTIGHSLPPGIYKITDLKLMLKFYTPAYVKVNTAIDDIALKSSLTINKTKIYT